jgi:hypothetical protein
MPSHFSTIGFEVASEGDLRVLVDRIADRTETIAAEAGQYLKWAPATGEQLWLQLDRRGILLAVRPASVLSEAKTALTPGHRGAPQRVGPLPAVDGSAMLAPAGRIPAMVTLPVHRPESGAAVARVPTAALTVHEVTR